MPSKPKLHEPSADEIAALITNAKAPEKPVPLCMRGDLQGDYEALELELNDALMADRDSMVNPAAEDIKARMAALIEQIKASTLTFRMKGLPKPRQIEIEVAHPAREGVERDKELGYDADAVAKAMIRESCVFPPLSGELWDHLDATLTTWQKSQLETAAYQAGFRGPTVSF